LFVGGANKEPSLTSGRPITRADVAEVQQALRLHNGNKKQAADSIGMARSQFYKRLAASPAEPEPESPFAIKHAPPIGTSTGQVWEIKSRADNTYKFAAFGDLHAGSKYCRWDVRKDLHERAEKFKAQAILDTGNWVDGCRPWNIHDLEKVGCDEQIQLLAERYPKTAIPTYAVTGADHEGWWAKSEGIDIGGYCQSVMRAAGHNWTDLGYMQADILLKNANSGATSILRIMHPGGGSAYAVSYKPQKIIESFQGGQKPAVLILGHYHKIDFGYIRNVWYIQAGCCQDQTPFAAQKALDYQIGGFLIEFEQDPETGAIIAFKPEARCYFDRAYYFETGQANRRFSSHGPIRQVPKSSNQIG
jgi:Bacterial regulatory protein, Fis family